MYYVDCERFPQRIMTLSTFVRVGAKLYLSGLPQKDDILALPQERLYLASNLLELQFPQ